MKNKIAAGIERVVKAQLGSFTSRATLKTNNDNRIGGQCVVVAFLSEICGGGHERDSDTHPAFQKRDDDSGYAALNHNLRFAWKVF